MFISFNNKTSELVMRNNQRASELVGWKIFGNAEAEVSEAGACEKR